MARGDSYQLQGQQGGVVITNVDPATGNFRWIQVINDTVFEDLVSQNLIYHPELIGLTIPAGIGIGGKFTSIAVTSGVVIAYYE